LVAVLCDLVEAMKAPITSAQAMSHPAVVATINVLSELCKELRAELETARADERESIAQMFEGAPALVQFVQNDQGGCLICGFTPKLVIEAIRARGTS